MPTHTTNHNDPDRLLTTVEVSERLGVPLNTLYKWTSKGHPYFPRATRLPNREIRVRVRDLDGWLEERAA